MDTKKTEELMAHAKTICISMLKLTSSNPNFINS